MTAGELKEKYREIWEIDYEEVVQEASQGEVLASVHIGDSYSGEAHFLVKKDDQYAHVTTGYGSCSYCDVLQAIQGSSSCWFDMVDFIGGVSSGLMWKSHAEMVEYINHHDFEGCWYGCDTRAWHQFKNEVVEALENK